MFRNIRIKFEDHSIVVFKLHKQQTVYLPGYMLYFPWLAFPLHTTVNKTKVISSAELNTSYAYKFNISVTALNPKGGMKGQPDMCFWEIDYDEDMELIPQ